MLRRVIGEDVELVTQLAPALWSVRVDPGQVEQVVMNLAVNARDAMRDGGRLLLETGNVVIDSEVAAWLGDVEPGAFVEITVSDTGAGMSPETLSRVFEPFYTTKGALGTGLGLSTAYGIVRQSGGHLSVHSEVGQGTSFRVFLPRQCASHEAEVAPEGVGLPRGRGESVLVVEDADEVRELLGRYLTRQGYRVELASGARRALERAEARQEPYALVLTDVVMPGMGASEMVAELRGRWPALRVVYMSGYAGDALRHREGLEAGTDFIAKPFTFAALGRLLERVLSA